MLEGGSGPGAGHRWATEYMQEIVVLAREYADGQDVNNGTIHFSRVDGQVRVMVQAAHIEASKSDYAQANGVQAGNNQASSGDEVEHDDGGEDVPVLRKHTAVRPISATA